MSKVESSLLDEGRAHMWRWFSITNYSLYFTIVCTAVSINYQGKSSPSNFILTFKVDSNYSLGTRLLQVDQKWGGE